MIQCIQSYKFSAIYAPPESPPRAAIRGRTSLSGSGVLEADRLRNAIRECLVDGGKHRHYRARGGSVSQSLNNRKQLRERKLTLPRLDFRALRVLEVHRNVVHEVVTVGIAEHLAPQRTGLFEVDYRSPVRSSSRSIMNAALTLGDLAEVRLRGAEEDLVLDLLVRLRLVLERRDAALVVRPRALVRDRHRAVPLEVRHGRDWGVNWDLVVVHTKAVAGAEPDA